MQYQFPVAYACFVDRLTFQAAFGINQFLKSRKIKLLKLI